jgi:hypothetical protein
MTDTITYESVGDFIKASDTEEVGKTSHIAGQKKFYGTETFKEAVELATRGWPKGRKRLAALRAQLDHVVEKAVSAKACTLHWDVAGDFIDVGRVLSGEAETFGAIRDDADTQPSTRVARIVANVSALGVVESESIFSSGAAIYAAVDILESLGHRVELWLGSGSETHSGKQLTVLVLIKEAGQPFDADRLAFFLCNNASLRRMFFSIECDNGHDPSHTRTAPLAVEEGSIVTPEVQPGDDTAERRIERVLEVCKACGVSFSAEELETIVSG